MAIISVDLKEIEEHIPGATNYHNLPRKKKKLMRKQINAVTTMALMLAEIYVDISERDGVELANATFELYGKLQNKK